MLSKTTNNPSSFVAVKRAITQELVTEDPFPYNNINTGRSRYQGPGIISLQCIELGLHGGALGRIGEGGADGWQHRGEDRCVEVEAVHWLAETSFATGAHVVLIHHRNNGLRRCGGSPASLCARRHWQQPGTRSPQGLRH